MVKGTHNLSAQSKLPKEVREAPPAMTSCTVVLHAWSLAKMGAFAVLGAPSTCCQTDMLAKSTQMPISKFLSESSNIHSLPFSAQDNNIRWTEDGSSVTECSPSLSVKSY